MIFVTPKAATKHELMFNRPASEVGLQYTWAWLK